MPDAISLDAIHGRILLGPGPSNCHPSVLRALAAPLVGHLDPQFIEIMNEIQDLLREVFRTGNRLTIPVSGTGSAGMETVFVNLLEPGDTALVCVNGVFGTRMSDIVERCGGKLIRVDAPWGRPVDIEAVRKALADAKVKLLAVVHAETSTGVLQPLEELSRIAHDAGALFLVDTVTSLGGCDVRVDDWKIDACYSGTQKCLSCPPGLSPVTFSEQALAAIQKRKNKVQSWYLDMNMVMKYWGPERTYHHTAPVSMNYALRQALLLIVEEGLEKRFHRHLLNHRALVAGLQAMGLSMLVEKPYRLPTLNTVLVPEGVDEAAVRKRLLQAFDIEIGSGLGDLKGKTWRIGLMGFSSSRNNVLLVLAALAEALGVQGRRTDAASALAAANAVYES
ncbi:MAG: alanine--glyoxylate aminotransferase family protein [Planctomycetota bacterium]